MAVVPVRVVNGWRIYLVAEEQIRQEEELRQSVEAKMAGKRKR